MPDRPDKIIYKVISENAWNTALVSGAFEGSADDIRDGYIHMSAGPHQLAGTLAKYFRNATDHLLVAYDPVTLGPHLKWEISRGGDRFPHLYSMLPTVLALWVKPLALSDDGTPVQPAEAL